jgi:hypothetical protein
LCQNFFYSISIYLIVLFLINFIHIFFFVCRLYYVFWCCIIFCCFWNEEVWSFYIIILSNREWDEILFQTIPQGITNNHYKHVLRSNHKYTHSINLKPLMFLPLFLRYTDLSFLLKGISLHALPPRWGFCLQNSFLLNVLLCWGI